MPWPTPTDYRHAIQDPRRALGDEESAMARSAAMPAACRSSGRATLPAFIASTVRPTSKTWALECFTRGQQPAGSLPEHCRRTGVR